MTLDLWNAVVRYCDSIGELSVSSAVRRLLRDQPTELGFLSEDGHSRVSQQEPVK